MKEKIGNKKSRKTEVSREAQTGLERFSVYANPIK